MSILVTSYNESGNENSTRILADLDQNDLLRHGGQGLYDNFL